MVESSLYKLSILVFNQPQTGSWLVDIISWLIKISTSIGLGVILFTLLLKLITLPFDFVSRANMRKNTLKMEEMRPELEKLQKQYANDKNLYNQKVMALYKKNGYSMWGACLPTILTLVIFIVAINAFTNYSRFENKRYLYNMTNAYNNVVYSGLEVDNDYIVKNADGSLNIDFDKIMAQDGKDADQNPNQNEIEITSNNVTIFCTESNGKHTLYTSNSYVVVEKGELSKSLEYKLVDNFIDKLSSSNASIKNSYNNNLTLDGKSFEKYLESANITEQDETLKLEKQIKVAKDFIKGISETKSAQSFRSEETSFLWVKNIWVTDSPTKHPIESDWDTYVKNNIGEDTSIKLTKDEYNSLIKRLDKEKIEPNGYFILVALTALSSLLMQWISSKSQKAQMELQTVDGQGATTNKMMMWLMPIMMAVFAFIYTAAFSIYIVLSSVFSMLTTFLINLIIDKKYKKQSSEQKAQVVRGRIYTPPKEEAPKKKEKPKKKEELVGDFITGRVKTTKKK